MPDEPAEIYPLNLSEADQAEAALRDWLGSCGLERVGIVSLDPEDMDSPATVVLGRIGAYALRARRAGHVVVFAIIGLADGRNASIIVEARPSTTGGSRARPEEAPGPADQTPAQPQTHDDQEGTDAA
ncbi:MAG: hypothetical protein M3P43_02330 [Actinomycetota bacterium]|nr:hypothetical protein [Actinomycetota bacterium]